MPDTPVTRRDLDMVVLAVNKLESTIQAMPDKISDKYLPREVYKTQQELMNIILKGFDERVESLEDSRSWTIKGFAAVFITGLAGVIFGPELLR